MGNKAQVIDDTEEMIQILCDTTKLQKDIETLTTKAEDIVVLAEKLNLQKCYSSNESR